MVEIKSCNGWLCNGSFNNIGNGSSMYLWYVCDKSTEELLKKVYIIILLLILNTILLLYNVYVHIILIFNFDYYNYIYKIIYTFNHI